MKSIHVPHVHADSAVDLQRVGGFAEAGRMEQLAALTELRRQVVDDSNAVDLGVFGAVLGAGIGVLVSSADTGLPPLPWYVSMAVFAVVGLLGGALLLGGVIPLLVPMLKRSQRRERAELWLRAYEDELTRRWMKRGRTARHWQAIH